MRNLRRKGLGAGAGALFVLLLSGCGPSYPECYDDETCQEEGKNEYCLNAKCAQCRDDSHCEAKFDRSYVCERGTCSKIAGFCDPPDFPCPAGQKCRDNRCGPECLDSSECPADRPLCENGRCVAPPECTTDADCPAGMVCQNNRCIKPPECLFRTIYFDFDESAIRNDQKGTLDANSACWKERKEKKGTEHKVEITGHCDERGTEEYNLALGKKRAQATEKALSKLGVPGKRLSIKSRGEADPAVPNASSEAEHQKNRRAEFELSE